MISDFNMVKIESLVVAIQLKLKELFQQAPTNLRLAGDYLFRNNSLYNLLFTLPKLFRILSSDHFNL